MTISAMDDDPRDAAGRLNGRSSFLGHPRGSGDRRRARGPCRRGGNRRGRDSHPGLDGAQNAPPTTAHRRTRIDEEKKTRKDDAGDNSRRGTQDPLPSVASLR